MKMAEPTIAFKCPQCRKPVERGSEHFPFCCERCRTTDLGHWAAGDYSIAGEPAPIPDDSDSQY
ncbi:MAG: DNA gyrase inhibitor YacG [Mariprofundaceae bacterium]